MIFNREKKRILVANTNIKYKISKIDWNIGTKLFFAIYDIW